MRNPLKRARQTAEKIADDPYRPKYHPAPPIGWMNDPNGLIWYGGKAHLFYQYYPYAPNWGRMHWGHMTSCDLVRWEHLPVALAPDQAFERLLGCFSGTAIAREDKLFLLYTGVSALGGQQQCLALSEDGIDFTKRKQPVIGRAQLPKGSGKFDFRDPKVFQIGELYYCLVSAAAKKAGRRGRQIACYTSQDLIHWKSRGAAFEDYSTDQGIFECPDLFSLEGTDVLMMSSMLFYPTKEETRFQNLHPSVYLPGKFDADACRFVPHGGYQELDAGFDFYAPQTFQLPDGRTILIAWKQMRKRTIPESKHGRAGAMTFPRELSMKGGSLTQLPARELTRYYGAKTEFTDVTVIEETSLAGICGNCVDLQITLNLSRAKTFTLRLLKGDMHETRLVFDAQARMCMLDRTCAGVTITSREEDDVNVRRARFERPEELEVRVLIDISSVELFINGGKTVMTANVYPDANDKRISFAAEGAALIKRVCCHPIVIE